jgi:hypothetical protein
VEHFQRDFRILKTIAPVRTKNCDHAPR